MMSQSHRSGYQVNSDLAALYNVHYLMHQSPQLRAVARHETHHAVRVTRSHAARSHAARVGLV